jgi:hypothetical protein
MISSTMTSLTMFVSWTIWKECNVRIFRNKSAPPTILLALIKGEAKRLWVKAGAKKLGVAILGE